MDDSNPAAARTEASGVSGKSSGWANRQAEWAVLISRIARGDQSAMARLYDETAHLVYSLALRVVGEAADAEEVAADTYHQVWRTAGRYSSERGTVFSWLMNITRTRGIDHLRARRTRNRASEPMDCADVVADTAGDPERLTEIAQQRGKVRAALAGLPLEQRRCIELAFYSGMTHSELAERLGEPLGTVKTRIRSGMLKLRSSLGDLV
jgi:RNA polymerase sigma-70 factor (ECF subfamily)